MVSAGRRPVEIQLRTARQHQWAELFEKLADKWGRAIRYGGPLLPQFSEKTNLVLELQRISDVINDWEKFDEEYVVVPVLVTIERYLDTLHEQLLEEP